jgi:hypothetical protein
MSAHSAAESLTLGVIARVAAPGPGDRARRIAASGPAGGQRLVNQACQAEDPLVKKELPCATILPVGRCSAHHSNRIGEFRVKKRKNKLVMGVAAGVLSLTAAGVAAAMSASAAGPGTVYGPYTFTIDNGTPDVAAYASSLCGGSGTALKDYSVAPNPDNKTSTLTYTCIQN